MWAPDCADADASLDEQWARFCDDAMAASAASDLRGETPRARGAGLAARSGDVLAPRAADGRRTGVARDRPKVSEADAVVGGAVERPDLLSGCPAPERLLAEEGDLWALLNGARPKLRLDRLEQAKLQVNAGGGAAFPLHLDMSCSKSSRRVPAALRYLNPAWEEGDGGEVELLPFPFRGKLRHLRRRWSDPIHASEGAAPSGLAQLEGDSKLSAGAGSGSRSRDDAAAQEVGVLPPPNCEHLVAELTQACGPQILNLILDHRHELLLDLAEFWSRGSELHTSGTCDPCPAFHRPEGCSKGRDCERCHIPHVCLSGSRPNKFKRVLLQRFSARAGDFGMLRDDELLRQAAREWASRSPRFRELLQEHAAPLLEVARAKNSIVHL